MTRRDVARDRNFTKQVGSGDLLLINYDLRRAAFANNRYQAKANKRLNMFRNRRS
jgi:hypothetical protein